jgi:small subunit ribosomal protein S1
MADLDETAGFAAMFAEMEKTDPQAGRRRSIQVGDEISGCVVAINQATVFIELDGKTEGCIERAELTNEDGELTVQLGDVVTTRVISKHDGQITLGDKMGRGSDPAAELGHAYEHRIPVSGTVSGVNKGGVEVQLGKLRAFCPMSQLDNSYVEDPSAFVGRELEFRITKLETGRGDQVDVVLSRRVLLDAERQKRAAEMRDQLTVGASLRGTVKTLKEFGAFIDLGGVEGLVHISQLGFGRIGHPQEVLSVGDEVEVQVLKVEPSDDPKRSDRISLSLKALQEDPWKKAVETLAVGGEVQGKVVRMEPFGAFISLNVAGVAIGCEGLVHVSEMSDTRRINHPREVLEVGREVTATVLEIDPERRRVGLSMKAVARNREQAQAANYKPAGGASMGTFADLLKGKLGKTD